MSVPKAFHRSIFLSITFLNFLYLPSAFAASEKECETVFCGLGLREALEILRGLLDGSGIATQGSLTEAILFWVKVLLIFSGLFAFVAFVWAGFLYITSFANGENHEQAKKIIKYAIIGILVTLVSFNLVDLFVNAAV